MQIRKVIKQWFLELLIIALGLVLFFTGKIFDLLPTVQVLMKKTFLVMWWYGLTYLIRRLRLGGIEWDETGQQIYYFVLLIGSSLIFALA